MVEEIKRYERVVDMPPYKLVKRDYHIGDERGAIGSIYTNVVTHKEWEREDDARIVDFIVHRRGLGYGRRFAEFILKELACQTAQKEIRISAIPESKGFWRKVGFTDTPQLGPNEMVITNPHKCEIQLRCAFIER